MCIRTSFFRSLFRCVMVKNPKSLKNCSRHSRRLLRPTPGQIAVNCDRVHTGRQVFDLRQTLFTNHALSNSHTSYSLRQKKKCKVFFFRLEVFDCLDFRSVDMNLLTHDFCASTSLLAANLGKKLDDGLFRQPNTQKYL